MANKSYCVAYILGDVHGNFKNLNYFIDENIRKNSVLREQSKRYSGNNVKFSVVILQCGDMAWFWPGKDSRKAIKNKIDFLEGGRVPVYWCAGNHEDHDELDLLFRENTEKNRTGIVEIDNGVFFCRFGSTLRLSDKINVLFAGGALSIDRLYRVRMMAEGYGKLWWSQECVDEEDMSRLPENTEINWVVSHTAPMAFDITSPMLEKNPGFQEEEDPSRDFLEAVRLKYHPSRWFFGHYHHYMSGFCDRCRWIALPSLDSSDMGWTKETISE